MIMEVKATDVQVGDKVIDLSEVDFIVATIRRVAHEGVPAEIRSVGGWVSLAGDSTDKYFQRYYDGEEDYYAHPTEIIKIER
jgi:hypothetical protein